MIRKLKQTNYEGMYSVRHVPGSETVILLYARVRGPKHIMIICTGMLPMYSTPCTLDCVHGLSCWANYC